MIIKLNFFSLVLQMLFFFAFIIDYILLIFNTSFKQSDSTKIKGFSNKFPLAHSTLTVGYPLKQSTSKVINVNSSKFYQELKKDHTILSSEVPLKILHLNSSIFLETPNHSTTPSSKFYQELKTDHTILSNEVPLKILHLNSSIFLETPNHSTTPTIFPTKEISFRDNLNLPLNEKFKTERNPSYTFLTSSSSNIKLESLVSKILNSSKYNNNLINEIITSSTGFPLKEDKVAVNTSKIFTVKKSETIWQSEFIKIDLFNLVWTLYEKCCIEKKYILELKSFKANDTAIFYSSERKIFYYINRYECGYSSFEKNHLKKVRLKNCGPGDWG